MATEVIRIDAKAYETLKKISELSGQEMKVIVDEWLFAIQGILDRCGACTKITVASKELVTKKGNVTEIVGTVVLPLYSGSFKFTENLSERAKEFLEKELVEADIEKKKRLKL